MIKINEKGQEEKSESGDEKNVFAYACVCEQDDKWLARIRYDGMRVF